MAAPKNASLSEVDPEFAPFIPNINAAFEKIWDFKTAAEFRSKISGARPSYPPYIPSSGFDISHQKVPVSDGNEIEIRIYRPEGTQEKLPIFYAVHGGGGYNNFRYRHSEC
jgi:acetyl esterase/lipase